jgi:hypothetical protein
MTFPRTLTPRELLERAGGSLDDEPRFRVCAYNDAGRWQPAVLGVPVSMRTPGGWIRGSDAAAVAALTAAASGSPKVVVVDLDEASVMEFEGRKVTYPPEWVDVSRQVGSLEDFRDIMQKRLLVGVGFRAMADAGVSRDSISAFSDEWLGVVGADLSRMDLPPAVVLRLVAYDGVVVSGEERPREIVVVPRAADGVAFHAARPSEAAAYLTTFGLSAGGEAASKGIRGRVEKLVAGGAEAVLVPVGRGPEGAAFVDRIRESVGHLARVEPVVAARRGWFEDLEVGKARAQGIGR